jgi:hypothetical protein
VCKRSSSLDSVVVTEANSSLDLTRSTSSVSKILTVEEDGGIVQVKPNSNVGCGEKNTRSKHNAACGVVTHTLTV